jgi:hypothetical protein
MAWPRVLALNLGTCFASLLDDEVGGVTLDDCFDVCLFVPRYDDEACEVRCDAVVFSGRKLDRLYAPFGRALAMEGKELVHAVLLGAFLDPLVDRPKDFFILRGRISEVHEAIVPRSVPNAKRARADRAGLVCNEQNRGNPVYLKPGGLAETGWEPAIGAPVRRSILLDRCSGFCTE